MRPLKTSDLVTMISRLGNTETYDYFSEKGKFSQLSWLIKNKREGI